MTAGSGLLHIETPPEWLVQKGGLFHGIQLWVNLPRAEKLVTPRYQDLRAGRLGTLTTDDAGVLVRVIAGDVAGHAGPGSTHTPITLVHATLAPGARLALPWSVDFNALVYVLQNWKKHVRWARGLDPRSSAAWCTGWGTISAAVPGTAPVVAARTWLARVGWRRHGLLNPEDVPRLHQRRGRMA